jgi:hypothetical protein
MTMKSLETFLLIALLLIMPFSRSMAQDKYQIVTSSEGNVYRMDKASGEVWLIKGRSMEKLQEKDFRLKIGNRYIGEDLYSFTYLGKGQVGEIKTLDDFWEKKKE